MKSAEKSYIRLLEELRSAHYCIEFPRQHARAILPVPTGKVLKGIP